MHLCLSRDLEFPGREKRRIVKVAMKIVQAAEEGPFDIVVKDSNNNEFKKKRKMDALKDDKDDRKG